MTSTTAPDLSIDRLDVIAPGAFAAAVAPLFEGARSFLGRLAMARPFGSVEAMFVTARHIAHTMPFNEQIELVDAHPRLGAPPASVSVPSFEEQGYGRDGTERAPEATEANGTERALDATGAQSAPDMTEAPDPAAGKQARLAAEFDRLNAAYEARFGFRYCVFVAGRSRMALLPELVAALDADRDAELARALDAVVDIARDRYATMTAAAREATT